LLMRDEVSDALSDGDLLRALTETRVALVADERNLESHSAQSSYVTAAMLAARSGHRLRLIASNVQLLGNQPPLRQGGLIDQLLTIGPNLLPEFSFTTESKGHYDLAILGDTEWSGEATQGVRLNATSWQARMTNPFVKERWFTTDWPMGGLGAAAFAAAEAFKSAMRRLSFAAEDPPMFAEFFDEAADVSIELAPAGTRQISIVNQIDFISGGAINSAALYALMRLPELSGIARVIEDDFVDVSNLNRGMLFLVSTLMQRKANVLASFEHATFPIVPHVARFEPQTYSKFGQLSDAVFVGVDDISARWDVQRTWPKWLGCGATGHFGGMASFHTRHTPCAGCLHPKDEKTKAPVPTVAFVSFWAGLWILALYLRHLVGDDPIREQHVYFAPSRPERIWRAPVSLRPDCPVGCTGLHPNNQVVNSG
jgi:hypothetical protein